MSRTSLRSPEVKTNPMLPLTWGRSFSNWGYSARMVRRARRTMVFFPIRMVALPRRACRIWCTERNEGRKRGEVSSSLRRTSAKRDERRTLVGSDVVNVDKEDRRCRREEWHALYERRCSTTKQKSSRWQREDKERTVGVDQLSELNKVSLLLGTSSSHFDELKIAVFIQSTTSISVSEPSHKRARRGRRKGRTFKVKG
jgi:hypothetical protein